MMDTRNADESRRRWATGIRAATIVVVLGTLVTVWRPTHTEPTATVADAPSAVSASPDRSVYFPDRFPAPRGPVEPLPPQF
jgi:hypothetical protein